MKNNLLELRDQGRGHRNGWASPGPQERLRPTVPLKGSHNEK